MSDRSKPTSSTPRPDLGVVPPRYLEDVIDLFDTWSAVRSRNAALRSYVEMKNAMKDLGVSIPPDLTNVNSVVGWADKAMRVRVVRSKFQGFVFEGDQDRRLDMLARRNRLVTKYGQACRGALTYGCSAFTVMRGTRRQPPVMVRSFSANQCCMLWDKDADGIGCGIAVVGVDRQGVANRYVLHEPEAVVTFTRVVSPEGAERWESAVEPHVMGRPLMVPLIHDADDDRPLGHSIITPELMGIIDKAMRDVLRMEVGAEFFTAPQRYILGADPDLFSVEDIEDAMREPGEDADDDADDDVDERPRPVDPHKMMRAYLGAFLALTRDADGNVPQVGQFAAGDAGNFISVFENDAQRFSGATNVPLGQLGVLSNTYTSSDALGAANDPLILDVERINASMGESMEEVARLMMALDRGVAYEELGDREMGVVAQFMDPAKPTISASADAWTKIGAEDKSLVGTRVWYEGLGLPKATIDRIMRAREQQASIELLNEIAAELERRGGPTPSVAIPSAPGPAGEGSA